MKNKEFELNSHFSQVAADHGDMQQDRETGYNVVVVDISWQLDQSTFGNIANFMHRLTP